MFSLKHDYCIWFYFVANSIRSSTHQKQNCRSLEIDMQKSACSKTHELLLAAERRTKLLFVARIYVHTKLGQVFPWFHLLFMERNNQNYEENISWEIVLRSQSLSHNYAHCYDYDQLNTIDRYWPLHYSLMKTRFKNYKYTRW